LKKEDSGTEGFSLESEKRAKKRQKQFRTRQGGGQGGRRKRKNDTRFDWGFAFEKKNLVRGSRESGGLTGWRI